MTEILSAEEVARWLANVDYEYPGAADALAEHDDALRRRLAEVEAERDQLGVLYRKADAGRRTESRRLAEVEQALRKYGEHRIGCATFPSWGRSRRSGPCDCGLDAVLDKGEQA